MLDASASPFGRGPATILSAVADAETASGQGDLDDVLVLFAALQPEDAPVLRLSRCHPTAAFSRRDTLLPGYAAAADAVRALGYEPVVRPVGGRLAAYDEGSIVLHAWGPHADPRTAIEARFRTFAHAFAGTLGALGAPDVRIGAVPGEYCAGAWSVNRAGRDKLAGTAQRVTKQGYLFSAVITVHARPALTGAVRGAYAALGLDVDPATVGAVDRVLPGVSVEGLATALTPALLAMFDDG